MILFQLDHKTYFKKCMMNHIQYMSLNHYLKTILNMNNLMRLFTKIKINDHIINA